MPVSILCDDKAEHTRQLVHRRNYTCPRSEDVAVVISLLQDPATNSIASFCISTFSDVSDYQPDPVSGGPDDLIDALASSISAILALPSSSGPRTRYTSQFYTFSAQEGAALQRYIIDAALTADTGDTHAQARLRLCVGALCEGAALLATAFQPVVLSGALLDFLGARGGRTKRELQACLARAGLPADGTVEQLRARLVAEVERLKAEGGRAPARADRPQLGLLPRVVVVKREAERLLALPVPGYWDLPEACIVMLPDGPNCSADDELYEMFRKAEPDRLREAMEERNECVWAVLSDLRQRATPAGLLVNDAQELSVSFMDLCQQEHLRKLFFMQQVIFFVPIAAPSC
jgi:hypothetical protein